LPKVSNLPFANSTFRTFWQLMVIGLDDWIRISKTDWVKFLAYMHCLSEVCNFKHRHDVEINCIRSSMLQFLIIRGGLDGNNPRTAGRLMV
jgi:hypothetical protein